MSKPVYEIPVTDAATFQVLPAVPPAGAAPYASPPPAVSNGGLPAATMPPPAATMPPPAATMPALVPAGLPPAVAQPAPAYPVAPAGSHSAGAPQAFASTTSLPDMPPPSLASAPPAVRPPSHDASVETPMVAPPSGEAIAALNPGTGIPSPELVEALHQVLITGASDLHIAPGAPPMLRVDGGLDAVPGSPIWEHDRVRESLMTLLTAAQRERFGEALELDFAYTLSANARFRVNYYQDRGSMGAAFRIIPTRIKSLQELGVSPDIGRFASLPRGLVLITGPTGSGKSTTLAALIDQVNETRRDHVVTVEDPIEFLHRNKRALINQREVGRDTHSFANALKHVLRQDPDVILIGELRDLETISVALTAAETGHLVFATLHTQSAPTTIDRIIDVFPPHQQDQVRTQLAATLQGVVCQTLIKRAKGSGRVAATEVMFTTPAIANLVREGKTYQITSALQSGLSSGMHTMDQALADLVNQGIISHASALEKSQDSDTLERLITRKDMSAPDPLQMGAF